MVTHAGDAPNAVPERATGRWYVRAETLAELAALEPRVTRAFEAGALATGCELRIEPESKPYAEFRADETALGHYRANALALGREFAPPGRAARMNRASTDMGNVSQVVPAIHPYIGIGSLPATNHQREFAAHCVGGAAERALLDRAVALAWTGVDRALDRAPIPDRAKDPDDPTPDPRRTARRPPRTGRNTTCSARSTSRRTPTTARTPSGRSTTSPSPGRPSPPART
ncbi:hypothetical protein O1L60_36140 [Streptomyces diastatochromogenes]|nr:hypothetical protein [Streptomyces diastatochromogenes]